MDKWLRQALADLEAARVSLAAGHFEWSCFQAQQAAEKAMKAFLYARGYTSILTHSLKELTSEAVKLEPVFRNVASAARRLDTFYVPTRYPNGLAGDMTPAEFYEQEDAEQCLSFAESILTIVKEHVKSS